jgi:hypothetical protein
MNMIRIQLDLPEDRVRELDSLMREAQITTRKDLFNSALTLLAWALNERERGRIIASLDENTGGYKELVMPFFSFLKKRIGGEGSNRNGHGRDEDIVEKVSGRLRQESASVGEPSRGTLGKARSKTAGVIEAAASTKGRR